jgi:MFS family permease
VIYYLTQWYPSHRRAKVIAFFMAAAPLSGVIGGPLSGYIMQTMHGLHGLAGWQWMFIIEALPSVLVGLFVFFYLNDEVSEASWLTEEEKQLVKEDVHAEHREKPQLSLSLMFANSRVWLTAFLYFCFVMSGYAISFWLPTLIKATGVKSLLDIGLLSSIPFVAAIITMMFVSRSADKKRERRWHVALPAIIGAVGLVASAAFSHNTWLAMAALSIASAGIFTIYPIFWSLPTAFLSGTAAAAGIALINSLGNLAGFVSPYLVGWVKDMTQSTSLGMGILAFFLLLGAALTFTLPARLVNK